jgi:hypothetical protein
MTNKNGYSNGHSKEPIKLVYGGDEYNVPIHHRMHGEIGRLRRRVEDALTQASAIDPKIVERAKVVLSRNHLPETINPLVGYVEENNKLLDEIRKETAKREESRRLYRQAYTELHQGEIDAARSLYQKAMNAFPIRDSRGLSKKLEELNGSD